MPIEFIQQQQPTGSSSDTLFKLTMAYDGSGRRISKTSMRKAAGAADWDTTQVTHYTGIGTEIRENYAGPVKETKVVVNMPNGLGRYGIEDAGSTDNGSGTGDIPNAKFEWYLKNLLGSTMLVYGTQSDANSAHVDIGTPLAAYDYRAFGEMIELTPPPTGKVTENFTGKEHDDEIALNYFGARYLDPMLGMWTSVDPARQFASPYLYAGNGVNPVIVVDPDGTTDVMSVDGKNTIQGGLTHIDDGINSVLVKFANGTELSFLPPPEGSYFSLENLDKQKFDPNMQQNADAMVKDAAQYWPLDFWGWGTKGPFDFKNAYYFGAGNTVGVLNRTIMTARDAGNAIWGGWTRHKYLNNVPQLILAVGGYTPTMIPLAAFCSTTEGQHLLMQGISNIVAPGMKEDAPSATMQSWGFYNYTPK